VQVHDVVPFALEQCAQLDAPARVLWVAHVEATGRDPEAFEIGDELGLPGEQVRDFEVEPTAIAYSRARNQQALRAAGPEPLDEVQDPDAQGASCR
jgi:hypothetical protein